MSELDTDYEIIAEYEANAIERSNAFWRDVYEQKLVDSITDKDVDKFENKAIYDDLDAAGYMANEFKNGNVYAGHSLDEDHEELGSKESAERTSPEDDIALAKDQESYDL